MTSQQPILKIIDLSIDLPQGADRPYAVENIDIELFPAELLCIVGESGSGKSMTSNAVMGLLPPLLRPSSGKIEFEGINLINSSEEQLQSIRGQKIAMIFQEPMTALNPLMRVGEQVAEVFEAHDALDPKRRTQRVLELLTEVGIPDPQSAIKAYPFQLSGGQRQRVMIAMALALEPKILIADEPTTALDVTTQAQILKLIKKLQVERQMAVIFVTHDFGVVAEIADRIAVMQYGKIVEMGDAEMVLKNPSHAYTKGLLDAIPKPQFEKIYKPSDTSPLLAVDGLQVTFKSGGGLFSKPRVVHAVKNVSFELAKGETLGIVGESGSGKSTAGRCLLKLIQPDAGAVKIHGVDLSSLSGAELKQQRSRIQMVFQDPYASLNPRSKIGTILSEGLVAQGVSKKEALERAKELLGLVSLDPSAIHRFPHEFSGGQRQRIGIARALAVKPEIIVADEAVSALDVSVQAQVLDLLTDLKKDLDLSLVFITHDLRVAAKICDRIAVMRKGEIIEIGPTNEVFLSPKHDYTKNLLAAAPGLELVV